jgi:nuclear transport factor 2 (NTF2) superfamily protein
MAEARPPVPPYTSETAALKARKAEDAWNTRNPQQVALAYTVDSVWRNRAEFLRGREAIEAFLTRKWQRELDYRLIKELWCCHANRIAVRFAYEWHDAAADRQHQRRADRAGRAQVPLAARPPSGRSSITERSRSLSARS